MVKAARVLWPGLAVIMERLEESTEYLREVDTNYYRVSSHYFLKPQNVFPISPKPPCSHLYRSDDSFSRDKSSGGHRRSA